MILVKNCGSKYERPKTALYDLVPSASTPFDRTMSESELKPVPLSCKKKLLGFAVPITGVIVSL